MADDNFFKKAGEFAGGIFGGIFGAGVGLIEGGIKAIETGKLSELEDALEKRTEEFLEGGKKAGEALAPKAANAVESLFSNPEPPAEKKDETKESDRLPGA